MADGKARLPKRRLTGGGKRPDIEVYDWEAPTTTYIEGRAVDPDGDPLARIWPTLADIAVEYGIPVSTVRHRSAQYDWQGQRDEFISGVEAERKRLVITKTGAVAARIDNAALHAAEAGTRLLSRRLERMARAEAEAQARDGDRAIGAHVDAQEVNQISLGLYRMQRVRAVATGQEVDVPDAAAQEAELRRSERSIASRIHEFAKARALPMDPPDLHDPVASDDMADPHLDRI